MRSSKFNAQNLEKVHRNVWSEERPPLTRLLWHFGCEALKSQCTKRAESASKCPVLEDGTPLKYDMPQKPWKLGTHVLTAAVGAVPHFMRRD